MKIYKIKDFCSIITGITPSTKHKEYYLNKNLMFIGPTDLKNKRYIKNSNKYISDIVLKDFNNRILNFNDIVVDCIGSDMGDVAIITQECLTNQQINAISNINTNIVIPLYLYYLLSTKKEYFHLIGSNGSTMPIINKTMFEKIELEIHELDEQQHIVDTIGSVDDLIEKNSLIINKLESIINHLFLKFTSKYELIPLRELNYFDICKSGINVFENNKIYLDTASVNYTSISNTNNIISYNNRPSRANMQPIANSVWFAKLKDSPKFILIKKSNSDLIKNYIFSTGFLGVKSDEYLINYLYTLILSQDFNDQKNLLSNGATMQGINNESFKNIKVPNVLQKDATNFGKKINEYTEEICLLKKKNKNLTKIKELLLQKYFG